jgi:hypothetical protein
MFLRLYQRWRDYHFIRSFGLSAILFVLFAGGVVVSVKIGGGSNLHNLDAYLALLLVVGSYIYCDQFIPDETTGGTESGAGSLKPGPDKLHGSIHVFLVAGALVIPLYFTLSAGGQVPHRDFVAAQSALELIDSAVQEAVNKGGEVLFINQRHLLTFDLIQQAPLVAEDELVFLMEMAMSNNSTYLATFQRDVSSQRFALIVAEPLTTQHQGRTHGFGEENDAWVERVSEPILCFYEPAITLDAAGVVLYTPTTNPCK